MELRHLKCFVAAAQEQHFGLAAKRLHVSQPAVSNLIHDLEKELGLMLFERLPRGVRLSIAGKAYLEDVQPLLRKLERAQEHARRVAGGEVGRLRVRFNPLVAVEAILRESIQTFRAARPDVDLDLMEMKSVDQLEALRTGDIDIGFLFFLPDESSQLDFLRIKTERTSLAVPSDHRLAGRRTTHLAELSNESFLWTPRSISPDYYDRLMSACRAQGFTPRIVLELNNTAAILNLVSIGMGVAFVTRPSSLPVPMGVRALSIADLDMAFNFDLVWRRNDDSPLVDSFIKCARALMAQVPGALARGRGR